MNEQQANSMASACLSRAVLATNIQRMRSTVRGTGSAQAVRHPWGWERMSRPMVGPCVVIDRQLSPIIEQLRRMDETDAQLLVRMGFYNDGDSWFDSHAWQDASPHA